MFPYPEPVPYPTPINTAVELAKFGVNSDGMWVLIVVATIGILLTAIFLYKHFRGVK